MDPRSTPKAAEPERWLDEHGDHLFRYAVARIQRPEIAEDLVQETLLAALKSADAFAGQSSERTWLIAILKRKMIDHLRRNHRVQFLADLETTDAWLDGRYDRTGHLSPPPGHWGADPAALLERAEFLSALEKCTDGLPERLRMIFGLRVHDDVPASEICASLEISSANLWTLLHRARLRIWNCLDRQGFGGKPP
jgi:RNA polymerase sigma-70 factor (ECF subfamily)